MEQESNEDDNNSNNSIITTPKLSLYSLPSQHSEPTGSESPPLRRASASVPFLWEEAPGKPRRFVSETDADEMTNKSLGLPPRLVKFTNMPSPTTVLDGPDVGRSLSFRISPESRRGMGIGKFGSSRWGSFRRANNAVFGGSFDISSEAGIGNGVVLYGGGGGGGGGLDGSQSEDHHSHHYYYYNNNANNKVSRRASFLSLSSNPNHIKSSPNLLASIYESFKQAVPWKRKQEKQRKIGTT